MLTSAVRPCSTTSWLARPGTSTTNATPHASCSSAGSYRPCLAGADGGPAVGSAGVRAGSSGMVERLPPGWSTRRSAHPGRRWPCCSTRQVTQRDRRTAGSARGYRRRPPVRYVRDGPIGPWRTGARACRTLVRCCRCWTPHARSGSPRAAGGCPPAASSAPADFAWRHRFVCLLVAAHLPALLAARPAARCRAARPPRPPRHLLLELTPRRGPAGRAAVGAGAAALAGVRGDHGPAQLLGGGGARLRRRHRGPLPLLRRRRGHRALPGLGVVRAGRRLRAPAARADRRVGPARRRSRWGWALVHAGFVLAESLVLVVFWHANEVARAEQDRLHAEQERLRAEQSSLRAEAAQLHEVLVARAVQRAGAPGRDRPDPHRPHRHGEPRVPHAADEHPRHGAHAAQARRAARRARCASSCCTACSRSRSACRGCWRTCSRPRRPPRPTRPRAPRSTPSRPRSRCSPARPGPSDPPVSVLVEPGTVARIDRQALHQVLANLVDNAQQHGAPGAVPILAAGRDERSVWLTVSNEGTTLTQEQSTQPVPAVHAGRERRDPRRRGPRAWACTS